MNIEGIRIENFMAIGSAYLDLKDRGLLLIQGENSDDTSAQSNGAGKSTIADGLSWCLFGVTARGESGDAIINHQAKKGAATVVAIEDDGDFYTVTRARKHKKFKNKLHLHRWDDHAAMKDWVASALELPEKAKDLTLGTDKLTQSLVEKILGCDANIFNAAIYSGQEKMPNLPGMTDKQLKEIIEKAGGIDILEGCYKEARSRTNEIEADYQAVQAKKAANDNMLASVADDIRDISRSLEFWNTNHKNALQSAATKLREFRDKAVIEKNRVTDIREKGEKARKRMNEIAGLLAGLDGENKHLEGLRAALQRHETELAFTDRQIAQAKADVGTIDSKIEKVKIDGAGKCDSCARPYSEHDAEKVIASLTVQKSEIQSRLDSMLEQHVRLSESVENARSERDAYASSMTDPGSAASENADCAAVVAEANAATRGLKALLEQLHWAKDEYVKLKAQTNPHEESLAAKKAKLASLEELAKNFGKLLVERLKKVEIAKKVSEVYSPAGVRAHILDHVTPFLNARTSHYLSVLSDGNLKAEWATLSKTTKGEIREKFNINVENAVGGQSFGLLSGGEKRKVRLACALALQDVVSQRALKPINLFMADEIDDALDDAGLERLMTLLEDKAREHGTVLVISHNELSDWIREQITIKKSGGRSSIV